MPDVQQPAVAQDLGSLRQAFLRKHKMIERRGKQAGIEAAVRERQEFT